MRDIIVVGKLNNLILSRSVRHQHQSRSRSVMPQSKWSPTLSLWGR